MNSNTVSFFNYNTGEFTGLFSCSNMTEEDIQRNIPANSIYFPETYSDDYYYSNGSIHKKPDRPSEYHDFDLQTKNWVVKEHRLLKNIRYKRNMLLQESDWTQLPDVSLINKTAWAAYRQELRDITTQADLFNITWPTPPNG